MSGHPKDWAWSQDISPTQKLVLLALARHADKAGRCWPKMTTLMSMTGLKKRTVIYAVNELCRLELITREAGMGRSTSRYQLITERCISCTSEVQQVHVRGALDASQGCTTCMSEVHQMRFTHIYELSNELSNELNTTTTTTTEVGKGEQGPEALEGGGGGDWIFPKELSEDERRVAVQLLQPVNGQAQALLDELAGQIKAGTIRATPMAYLRGMVRKARAGEFTREQGERIAIDRAKRAASEQRLREAAAVKPELPAADPEAKAKTQVRIEGLRKAMSSGSKP